MAYYYVKNGGSATGDAGRYASQQTGSFATMGAANYYNDIVAAYGATTTPVAGDFINVSDLHSYSSGTTITYSMPEYQHVIIACVDDANVDAARTSGNRGVEYTTSGASTSFADITAYGMWFQSDHDALMYRNNYFSDCKIRSIGQWDQVMGMDTTTASVTLVNCELALDDDEALLRITGAGYFEMNGGSVTTTSAGLAVLFYAASAFGGWTVKLTGVDLTAVTGELFGGLSQNDGAHLVHCDMCKLASGVDLVGRLMRSYDCRFLFTRCSYTSASAEHQYYLSTHGGDVSDNSTIHRDDDPAFEDSGTQISYLIEAGVDALLGTPLWFDFPTKRYAELSAGATDNLRFYVASTATLTDKDIYIDVIYPDGTNKQTPNFATSAPATTGGSFDVMATGTTLTTDSGSDWRNGAGALTGYNEYYIDVATSGDAGADSVPLVRVNITKASTDIYLASIYDLN